MTDLSKQIIPDSQAVAHFVDPEIVEVLDSHGTFTISELLEKIQQPDVKNAFSSISKNTNSVTILSALADGTSCKLLQPDGKGWQQGTLKLYFKFIPEETDSVVTQHKLVETHQSSLDAIRQLANE